MLFITSKIPPSRVVIVVIGRTKASLQPKEACHQPNREEGSMKTRINSPMLNLDQDIVMIGNIFQVMFTIHYFQVVIHYTMLIGRLNVEIDATKLQKMILNIKQKHFT